MFKREVQFWKESSWCASKDHTETWRAETKEDFFLKVLVENNRIQKNFDNSNGDCYTFLEDDYKLQDEYDEWWRNLGEEKREEIFANA